MEQETLQETIERLKKFPGKVRGEIFLNHAEYIKEKEGRGGLKKLEEKLEDLGVSIEFKKVKSVEWMNEGLSALVILVCKEIFYWEDRHVFEMGHSAPRFSLGLRVLAKNVILPRRLFEESPVYWKNLFDFGYIEPVGFEENLQQATLRIHEYQTHPLLCIYHAGYIKGLAEFVLKTDKVDVDEMKCVYKGDPYTEYKIKWS